eukprot:TRINITY_DN957_c0_g1_i11.p2 TRINITY_DN957_c0_g1~~TRINITY_DN957_c0_g1_i11.p2  ORF type:complete len:181 (+),score=11.07 TRINITY_DN957_c0_g1_i11:1140-1682(+)
MASMETLVNERYIKTKKLGEGTYGIVWKAENRFTGEPVALKQIRFTSEDEGVPCTAIREISLLKELEHTNVVGLIDTIQGDTALTLVFEYCDCDLKQYLDMHTNNLPLNEMKDLLYQLIKGVEFCHRRRVLHRDLKTQNLLIKKTPKLTLKLADFGLARASTVPFRNLSHEVCIMKGLFL